MVEPRKSAPIDVQVFTTGFVVVLVVLALLFFQGEKAAGAIQAAFDYSTNQLASLYIWFALFCLGVELYLVFGKHAGVRFGGPDARPEFSRLSWVAMFFCAGMGTALLAWASKEWSYHYTAPPFDVEPMSKDAARWAMAYGIFHWGPLGWVLYSVCAFPIGYAFYNRGKPALRLSTACSGLLGDARAEGPVGKAIDTLFIFGLVGGTGTTLVSATPMLSEAVCELFGLTRSFAVDASVVILWTALFTVTVGLGLKRGIQMLADVNIWAIFVLCGVTFLAGPTWYMLNTLTDSFGLMLNNFIRMSFYTAPQFTPAEYQAYVSGERRHLTLMFPQVWTVFYWAWYIAYAPYMGVFMARISRGRTFRDVVATSLCFGTLGGAAFFGIFGSNALYQTLTGRFDFIAVAAERGENAAIIGALMHMTDDATLDLIILAIFVFVGFVYSATTVNASAYAIATVSSKEMTRGTDVEPHLLNRITWAIFLGAIALGLMYQDHVAQAAAATAAARSGAALGTTSAPAAASLLTALKVSSLIVAVPLMACMLIAVLSFLRWIKEDEP
ncbi:MAG: BCCT family transporter [Myxococcales bacterium]|nr:BCCT family transporter [Myxococcales bacterium]